MDHYRVLDVPSNATKDEIRTAYKKMALKWHPDRHPVEKEYANQRFIQVHNAYKGLIARRDRQAHRQTVPYQHDRAVHKDPYARPNYKSRPPASSRKDPLPRPGKSSPRFSSSPTAHSKSPVYNSSSESSPRQRTPLSCNSICTTESSSYSSSDTSAMSSESSHSYAKTTPPIKPQSDRARPYPRRHFLPTKLRKRATPWQEQFSLLGWIRSSLSTPPTKKSVPPRNNSRPTAACRTPRPDSEDFIFVPPFDESIARFAITFTLEELFYGAHHRYRLKRHFLSGKSKNVVFDVHIPPGCHPGSKIIFHGAGNERPDGSLQDVVFVIEEAPHERFRRVKNDLVIDIKLPSQSRRRESPTQFSLHGLDGKPLHLVVVYPHSMATEGTCVIPAAGMPVRRHGKVIGRGDLIVSWEMLPPPTSKWDALKKALHLGT